MGGEGPVQWGVLGLANITRRTIPAIDRAANARLAAVASQRPAATAPLRESRPDLRLHDNYAALLDDAEIEAIYIPLPNGLHAEWAVRAAAAGKHVLCEKPLATTVGEVERMAAAAARHGTLLSEAFMWRYHPQHARVLARVAEGAIGRPRLVRASLSFDIRRDVPNIRLDPALGGGAIWDVGCYAVSIARYLFDAEPETISGVARVDPAFGVDLSLAAVASFPDERQALLYASMESMRRSAYEIVGTGGALRVEQVWTEPEMAARIVHTANDGAETVEEVAPADHFALQVEHLSEAVRGRAPLRYGPEDALAQARALAALQRSFGSGRAERP